MPGVGNGPPAHDDQDRDGGVGAERGDEPDREALGQQEQAAIQH